MNTAYVAVMAEWKWKTMQRIELGLLMSTKSTKNSYSNLQKT